MTTNIESSEDILKAIEKHIAEIRGKKLNVCAAIVDLTVEDDISYGVCCGEKEEILDSVMTILDKFETVELLLFSRMLDHFLNCRAAANDR